MRRAKLQQAWGVLSHCSNLLEINHSGKATKKNLEINTHVLERIIINHVIAKNKLYIPAFSPTLVICVSF